MISTQTVISQNHFTVACINAGDYRAAVVSATSALHYHRSIVALQNENDQTYSDPAYDQCMLLTFINANRDDEADDSQPFVYECGIQLPAAVSNPNTIAPILVFNTALAHHLLAIQCKEVPSLQYRYVRRANQLYALAYDAPDIDRNPLFQFAVINNAAVIAAQHGNMDSWNASMEYLLTLYMTLMDRGCTTFVRHMQGLLRNAMPSSPIARVA